MNNAQIGVVLLGVLVILTAGFLVGWAACAFRKQKEIASGGFYDEYFLKIEYGPGRGQVRRITGVTVDEPFDPPTTIPGAYEVVKR